MPPFPLTEHCCALVNSDFAAVFPVPELAGLWHLEPWLRIQTLLIQIRTLLFTLIQIRTQLFTLIQIQILLFNLIQIRIRLFNPDPYCCEEVMHLKQYFLYIVTLFSLSVGPTGLNQKAYFVKFSLPISFVVLI
jgi:hypothetical protein